jgi:tetratricopeptide (TPR) repeat protein
MESNNLTSRVIDDKKEFMVQTVHDMRQKVVRSSLFVNGNLLESSIMPYSDDAPEDELLNLLKRTHNRKKEELEYLLRSIREARDKGDPEVLYHLGSALYHKGLNAEACDLLSLACELRNNYHQAFFVLSQAATACGDMDKAKKAADRAVELSPHFADYRNNLGEICLACESAKRAVIEFEEALKLNVYYAEAYLNLALSYIHNGISHEDFDMYSELKSRALDYLSKATIIQPDFRTREYSQALEALSDGNLPEAFDLILKVRDGYKKSRLVKKARYFDRFLMYTDWVSRSQIADRIIHLENELTRNPNYVDLFYELALSYLHQARFDWQKGLEYLKKGLELNPGFRAAERALKLSEDEYSRICDTATDIAKSDG